MSFSVGLCSYWYIYVFLYYTIHRHKETSPLCYLLYVCYLIYLLKLCSCTVYEHWPETREFITRTIELWNRWMRLSCYYSRVYDTCPLYDLFCNALVHVIYSVDSGHYSYIITDMVLLWILSSCFSLSIRFTSRQSVHFVEWSMW